MKAIILDMDGLMIDSEKMYFEAEEIIALRYGIKVNIAFQHKLMGRSPLDAAFMFIDELKLPVTPEQFLMQRDEIMEVKYKNEVKAMSGLHDFIAFFYKKFMLAIATGSPSKFLDITVDKLKIKDYFDILQSSDNIKNGKPDPEIYIAAADGLKVDPEECIVLEDSSNGALSGKRAGCYTIGVYSEWTKGQDFSFVDFYADDLNHAAHHIRSKFLNVNFSEKDA